MTYHETIGACYWSTDGMLCCTAADQLLLTDRYCLSSCAANIQRLYNAYATAAVVLQWSFEGTDMLKVKQFPVTHNTSTPPEP